MPADQIRNRTVGCKMTDSEYERLSAVVESEGMTLGEWCREVLLERADGRKPSVIEETLLAEVLALRTILLNAFYKLAQGEKLTAEEMQAIIERADANKVQKAIERLVSSTLALTDGSGTLLASYAYEPFGNTTLTAGSSANPYQYTGRENDATGFQFNRARYYSPTLQRFVSQDPFGFYGGANLYAYANDNPTSLIDPLGLSPLAGRNCGNKACRDYFLRNAYGPIGNVLANTGVPEFSVVSLGTNFWGFAKGTALSLGAKAVFVGAPWAYGQLMTATGNNMMAYPGLAGAGADALETGTWWTGTATTVGTGLSVTIMGITAFSTTADLYARWVCRDVQ